METNTPRQRINTTFDFSPNAPAVTIGESPAVHYVSRGKRIARITGTEKSGFTVLFTLDNYEIDFLFKTLKDAVAIVLK